MNYTKGPWVSFVLVKDTGGKMSPEEIGDYVKNAVKSNSPVEEFLFISCTKDDGDYDVCHIGNGPDRHKNAQLISASPDMYYALTQIMADLPSNKDWLDPVIEKMANEALKKARGEA